MKIWISILFYSICFFVLATVLYRLALCVPPTPGTEAYRWYCLQSGLLAVLVAGFSMGMALCIDRHLTKK